MNERDVDWGATGRIDTYSFELVDPFTLAGTGTTEVKEDSSSISWDYTSENELQATLDMGPGNYRQGQYDRMVRIHHDVTIGDFHGSYTMGTLFVSNLENSALFGQPDRRLTCYGPWWRHTQDVFVQDFVRHVGDNVVDGIRYLVEVDGGTLRLGPNVPTDRTHSMDFVTATGFNKAEAIRTFAGWIGCEVVTSFDGSLELRAYVPPGEREPVYTFEDGVNCIYLPGVNWSTNRDEPINRVIAYFSREQKQDDDPYPLSDSVHLDLGPQEDYSYERCGRHRTQVLQVTEPCSHEELTAQAQRVLDERSAAVLHIEIEHAGVPFLRVGDAVRYVNHHDDENPDLVSIGIIEQMEVQSLGPFCMTRTKMRCYR